MLVVARCPGCGGGVEAAVGAQATCRYCGLTAAVATGPAAARAPGSAGPPAIVLPETRETPAGVWVGAAVVALAFGGSGIAMAVLAVVRDEPWLWLGAGLGAVLGGLAVVAGVIFSRQAARVRDVLRAGLPAEARVTSVALVNTNGSASGTFDLVVTVRGRAPYTARVQDVVPFAMVPRVVAGATLPVRVDSADPSFAVVEWDVLASRPAP